MERNENGLFVMPRQGTGTRTVHVAPREGCGREENATPTVPREGCGTVNMREGYGMGSCGCNTCNRRQLAMVYAPMQCFRMLYNHSDALMRGTLFEELDKPLSEGM